MASGGISLIFSFSLFNAMRRRLLNAPVDTPSVALVPGLSISPDFIAAIVAERG